MMVFHSAPTKTAPTTASRLNQQESSCDFDSFGRRRPSGDPFFHGRASYEDPFTTSDSIPSSRQSSEPAPVDPVPIPLKDRRLSKEWDASKVPPSRFQKLEGSIFATPASRDGHIAKNKLKMVMDKVKDKAKDKTHVNEKKK